MKAIVRNQISLLSLLILFSIAGPVVAQVTDSKTIRSKVMALDADFWNAYNQCKIEDFRKFLTEDLEFYHDKGGLTTGLEKMVALVKTGLCAKPDTRLRRVAIEETVQFFPLNNYGGVLTGEHLFYLTEKGKAERLVEKARFTHVWRETNDQLKMARVLSYDHQPASENSFKEQLVLSLKKLSRFAGNYQAPQTGAVHIVLGDDGLLEMKAGEMQSKLYPETETVFFMKEAPITLEFVLDNEGKSLKFIVRENGKVVEESIRGK